MDSPRYQGKPLLRLLECYVLKAIGQLSPQDVDHLNAMRPKLAQVYGVDATWEKIIEKAVGMPASMPALIMNTWEHNQKIALVNGVVLNAQEFAEMFVDQNFVP